MQGYIYLLKSDYGYKIGKSKNPKNRNNIFSVKLPFEVEMIKTIKVENYHQVEKDLHKHFEDKHLNGEWFDLTKEEIDEFERIVERYNQIDYSIHPVKSSIMFYEANFKLILWMVDENPTALKTFLWFVKHMDGKNALFISQTALGKALGIHRSTIHRSVKFLVKHECLSVFKSGNTNVYAINADIVWKNTLENKKFAFFDSKVDLSWSEQDDDVEFKTQLLGHAVKVTKKAK